MKEKNKWDNIEEEARLSWRAVHLLHYNNDKALGGLSKQIPLLSKMGINKIILEVDYHFNFKSHPELRQTDSTITKEGAQAFSKICAENGIEIIPQFQCVGHQSWAKDTWKLLEVYPELDLTPNAFPNNEGLYCREWDVTNKKVYEIIFPLIDEIIDAFNAKAIHVGMDEVFLLGSEFSPNTKGQDPAVLFAKAVNDMYNHLVKDKNVEMLMWGDRLIDTAKVNYGEWESAANGTASALDMIPKDIIICDWHYESFDDYKSLKEKDFLSIPMFLEKGFRVLPTSWRVAENMESLMYSSLIHYKPEMLGHLFILWSSAKGEELIKYQPMVKGLKLGERFFRK
ncbi:MAG: family 20 glycosylhydrolase [Melioribacteraceae bacterium]|nr:family 20 glycosylhydrolase [Melioribacteraceae bacterium]